MTPRTADSRIHAFSRRAALPLSIGAASLTILILIVLSPFALGLIAHGRKDDWSLLSNVGQTYGAVSAVLSAGALVGVVISVFIQVRELRHNREQAARLIQYDLLKMAMDNPIYMRCIGPSDVAGQDGSRQSMYLNLLLNFWQMRWEFGDMTEAEVRGGGKRELFASEIGREYWQKYGEIRKSHSRNRRSRSFHQILDEEYEECVRPPEPA